MKKNNRGKENNRGKTNNHGKAKMKETSTNNRESFAKKIDDRNAHHAFMPEYVYFWFQQSICKFLLSFRTSFIVPLEEVAHLAPALCKQPATKKPSTWVLNGPCCTKRRIIAAPTLELRPLPV